jgi:hypothetical protein
MQWIMTMPMPSTRILALLVLALVALLMAAQFGPSVLGAIH